MKVKYTLNIEPVFAKGFGWEIVDYYLATFKYKLFDGHIIGLQRKGTSPKESMNGILSYLDGEIADLTETRDGIKRWAGENIEEKE